MSSLGASIINGLSQLAWLVGIPPETFNIGSPDVGDQTAALKKILSKAREKGQQKYEEILNKASSIPFGQSPAIKNLLSDAKSKLMTRAKDLAIKNSGIDADINRAEELITQATDESQKLGERITGEWKKTMAKATDLVKSIEKEV